jgi:integrase/recombinase XerD
MTSAAEVQVTIDRLVFKKRHSDDCQEKNKVREWQQISDSRKRCACLYWSCGVHSRGEGFKRRSTGESSAERAKDVVRLRLETGKRTATLASSQGTPINVAIAEFMKYTADGGVEQSTLAKYKTLMQQLQAYADWKGFTSVRELDQTAVLEFRRAWEDKDSGYKRGRQNGNGVQLWRANSIGTCKRNAKTLRLFFRYCISRTWRTDDPTLALRFPKEQASKGKEHVKYLTPAQFKAILEECDISNHVSDYNKLRVKALILTMRWTGLRISDAVVLTADRITDGVLKVVTRKASTPVQIPIHVDLSTALSTLRPYEGGFLFWNKRTEDSSAATVQNNYGVRLAALFENAGIHTDSNHVSHTLRNTFAVDLLEKGVPLETVSILLGHKSVTTTERYYADFTARYMEKAADKVKKAWLLKEGEKLD